MKNKYSDVDRQVTNEIMKEFEGKVIEVVCDEPGCDEDCKHCNGKGYVKRRF